MQTRFKAAAAAMIVVSIARPAAALDFEFLIPNDPAYGGTAGTVTGLVTGLQDNASYQSGTNLYVLSAPEGPGFPLNFISGSYKGAPYGFTVSGGQVTTTITHAILTGPQQELLLSEGANYYYDYGGTGNYTGNDTGSISFTQNGVYAPTGGIQQVDLAPGTYQFTVAGAQGGGVSGEYSGGLGAVLSGDHTFTTTTLLDIVVGAQGGDGIYEAGGGGGTFLYVDGASTPLIVAGGGGGGGYDGAGGSGLADVVGSGQGGSASSGNLDYGGGGGGGWESDGQSSTSSDGGGGGGGAFTFAGGSAGDYYGGAGGFGGGGGGGEEAGGGGGGYTGGDAGAGDDYLGGDGGTSYIDAAFSSTALLSGENAGDGFVVITPVTEAAVPEPSTWAMMALGFAGLGFAGYRRATRARALAA